MCYSAGARRRLSKRTWEVEMKVSLGPEGAMLDLMSVATSSKGANAPACSENSFKHSSTVVSPD